MEKYEAIKYIENMEKGEFCTIKIPITSKKKIPITVMYMGKDKNGRYKFMDTGKFFMSEKLLEECSISVEEKYDRNKAREIYSKYKIIQEKKKKRENLNR